MTKHTTMILLLLAVLLVSPMCGWAQFYEFYEIISRQAQQEVQQIEDRVREYMDATLRAANQTRDNQGRAQQAADWAEKLVANQSLARAWADRAQQAADRTREWADRAQKVTDAVQENDKARADRLKEREKEMELLDRAEKFFRENDLPRSERIELMKKLMKSSGKQAVQPGDVTQVKLIEKIKLMKQALAGRVRRDKFEQAQYNNNKTLPGVLYAVDVVQQIADQARYDADLAQQAADWAREAIAR